MVTEFLSVLASISSFAVGLIITPFIKSILNNRQKLYDIRLDRNIKKYNDQLSLFYWPIYFRLLSSYATWKHIKNSKDLVSVDDRALYEKKVILPLHDEIIDIISQNIQIVEPDDIFLSEILKYFNHVEAYHILRDALDCDYTKFPRDIGAPFPDYFGKILSQKITEIQGKFKLLLLGTEYGLYSTFKKLYRKIRHIKTPNMTPLCDKYENLNYLENPDINNKTIKQQFDSIHSRDYIEIEIKK